MSKSVQVAKFTQAQITEAVNKVTLPASLQGFESWQGSKDVGGNSTAHLSVLNGKGQALGIVQCFADIHFGTAAQASILSGIEKMPVREAFRKACEDLPRLREFYGKPLTAERALAFLKAFTYHAMKDATITAPDNKVVSLPKQSTVEERATYPKLNAINGGASFGALFGETTSGAFSSEFMGAMQTIKADGYKAEAKRIAALAEAQAQAAASVARASANLPADSNDYPALASDYVARKGPEVALAFLTALASEMGYTLAKPRAKRAA